MEKKAINEIYKVKWLVVQLEASTEPAMKEGNFLLASSLSKQSTTLKNLIFKKYGVII